MRGYGAGSGTLQETAYSDAVADVEDMTVTPDGSRVITANGSHYHHQRWRLSDLTEEAQYGTGPYPSSVAGDSHGTVAAGIVAGGVWDVYVHRPGETAAYRTVALSPPPWAEERVPGRRYDTPHRLSAGGSQDSGRSEPAARAAQALASSTTKVRYRTAP
ncbi:hypothetical protein [Streptomyces sp. NPDC060002]|uniref:hypothetical protein n=1 Tax=Streptomyces sp. NPDC060002 TaxID=3347033 RepID=UPI0036C3EB2A